MKDETIRLGGNFTKCSKTVPIATLISIVFMSVSLTEFDELKPCIHSINHCSKIHISHSIHCLGLLQFF